MTAGRLALLVTALAALAPTLPSPLANERVWVPGPDDEAYDVSADGRFAGYIDWNSGNLMVRDLQTGTSRDLTKKGSYKDSDDEAESALFSPDGKRIAYEWWDSKTKNDEVRVINTDGTGVRTIFRESKVGVWPEDFTPDGRSIVTILDRENGVRQVALIPVDGGAPRILKTFTGRQIDVRISPDGRYLAFGKGDDKNDFRRDITVIAVADGREWSVVAHKADDYPVGWAADGTRLIFASDRNGSPGLWALPMANGHASGSPTLVRGDLWRMTAIRLTRQGKFFYHVAGGDRDVFTAPIDLESGRLLASPISVTGHPGEMYNVPQWSPDGKHVAYLMREASGVRHTLLVIRAVGGGEVREFLPKIFNPRTIHWVPNSQKMMINGSDKDNHPVFYQFDLKTGRAEPLITNTFSIPSFSADGRTMYYVPRPQGQDTSTRLLARNLATGTERQIYLHPPGGRINANALSPDGRFIVLVAGSNRGASWGPTGTLSVSLESGTAHNLGATIPFDPKRETQRHLGFTPDQKSAIIMIQRSDSMASFSLWRVPIEGGKAVRLPNAPPEIEQMGAPGSWLSPDGRRLVFVKGRQLREVWALEDPALRSSVR